VRDTADIGKTGRGGQSFVKAWDLPTRLFKWLLVLLVVLAWASNKYGAAVPLWHKANGYAILVLPARKKCSLMRWLS
jgi:cytochrome b